MIMILQNPGLALSRLILTEEIPLSLTLRYTIGLEIMKISLSVTSFQKLDSKNVMLWELEPKGKVQFYTSAAVCFLY